MVVKVNTGVSSVIGVLISPLPNQEGDKLHSPHFMELGGSLPHSQKSATCPYPSQIDPFLCPSHFWQAQLVFVQVGLRTYQHPSVTMCSLIGWYTHCRETYFFKVPWSEKQNVPLNCWYLPTKLHNVYSKPQDHNMKNRHKYRSQYFKYIALEET